MHTCNFVQKGVQGHSSAGVKQMFSYVADCSNVATRANLNGQLKVPRCRLRLSVGNIAVGGAGYFNKLPVEITMERGINRFKH